MKTLKTILLLTAFVINGSHTLAAQTADSVDVTDYDLTLDLSTGAPFAAKAVLTVQLVQPVGTMELQLMGTVDSIQIDGTTLATNDIAHIPVNGIAPATPFELTVWYHGTNYVESYGWGGFHFDNDMSYNLGVAFNEDPHAIGRAMFPCRDNFTDKATYTLRVKTRTGWTAECSGIKQSATIDNDGCEHTVWRIAQPTPTYLVSVSQANYHKIHTTAGGYPLTLGFTTQDSTRVAQTFQQLDAVVPMFEQCFGPYRWERIGYIATLKGSMEHVNNIALSRSFMADPTSVHGRITIPHELGHAWFGNLVTCRTEGDMWFNEGGASFTSEVAREATDGRHAATDFYQENLENVVRNTHVTDGAYLPLSPMPHSLTYGSTTYDKGALVWHSLRGYLGDSVFYAAMRRLFSDKAFGNVDAYEVRDSLSSYTGVDLTDFFNFHVFSAGFVDYHIEMQGDTLHISQQGVGTDVLARSNRVPVTYVAADGATKKVWYTFSAADTSFLIEGLGFTPQYCLLDKDCEISDAATRGDTTFTTNGLARFTSANFIAQATTLSQPTTVYVDHHWGRPRGIDTVDGVLRTANRYWTVSGNVDYTSGISGRFMFSRTSNLDRDFYETDAEIGSMVLMHRYNSHSPWYCITRKHTTNSNGGFFFCPLQVGEYTLAIVDTSTLSVPTVDNAPLSLFPNPLNRGEALTIQTPFDGTFSMTIYDAQGHKVWCKKACRNGRRLHLGLKAGSYLVVIQNKCVSLQSKLIQL